MEFNNYVSHQFRGALPSPAYSIAEISFRSEFWTVPKPSAKNLLWHFQCHAPLLYLNMGCENLKFRPLSMQLMLVYILWNWPFYSCWARMETCNSWLGPIRGSRLCIFFLWRGVFRTVTFLHGRAGSSEMGGASISLTSSYQLIQRTL